MVRLIVSIDVSPLESVTNRSTVLSPGFNDKETDSLSEINSLSTIHWDSIISPSESNDWEVNSIIWPAGIYSPSDFPKITETGFEGSTVTFW